MKVEVGKSRQINHSQLFFVHKVDKGPESELGIFHVVQNSAYNQVNPLDITDLRVIHTVLTQNLSKHLLKHGIVRKCQALRMSP